MMISASIFFRRKRPKATTVNGKLSSRDIQKAAHLVVNCRAWWSILEVMYLLPLSFLFPSKSLTESQAEKRMESPRLLFFLYPILILHLLAVTNAQPKFLYYRCSNGVGNYTNNSTYKANLNTLLTSLSSNNEIDYGFYNFSAGQNSDKVNAIALCRGDVMPTACRSCINDSRIQLTRLCPNQKEAIGWYDGCMLRYSNDSIFGKAQTSPSFTMWNLQNVSNVEDFNQVLGNLMASLRSKAASGDWRRKFATEEANVTSFQSIYGLMQCTPDLSELSCSNCLEGAINEIPTCSANAPPPTATPQPSPPSADLSPQPLANTTSTQANDEDDIINVESLLFDFDTIRVATNNFSDSNKLGQGGFGPVYKGKLSNGQDIAVKRLSSGSGQGELEFKNEVVLVAKLQHRNLVRLLGFCLDGAERLLIYEFVPNTSLDHFIFDPIRRAQLDWERRYKIIGGIARGLLYLHEDSRLRIIHRDLKASNILLDAEMNPKISDFGMARLFLVDQTQGSTSRIVGTYGYMAPEYAMHGHFSVKTDVYSFGVLVLELVSGQRNNCFRVSENIEHLLSYAWKNWREGTATNLIDPTMRISSISEIMRCIHIGLLCVQENEADRPTMASIALMLNSYSLSLPVPSHPAFFMNTSMNRDMSLELEDNSRVAQSNYLPSRSSHFSVNEASITDPYPR
ncbi:Cysteine-rich receptor-like protein kinase 26 [Vitis vinifera]|uniref:Cysteine-rich receptor-like protein kinase 26 n=1 Tax=Vitis vinifera TaxID=29760 RepID=A0A438HPF5_VITVI|nr:Cysteine-rich receptor-like protein kinase 26 [Vitis vinifera]